MSLNVKAIRESFDLVAPQADELAKRFYELLFENHADVKPLFENVETEDQQKKLIQSLVVIVKSLEEPEKLSRYLQDLGSKHLEYKVTENDYPAVAETLLLVLAEFAGDAWTDELEEAWAEALEAIAGLMLEGAANALANKQQEEELVTTSVAVSVGAETVEAESFETISTTSNDSGSWNQQTENNSPSQSYEKEEAMTVESNQTTEEIKELVTEMKSSQKADPFYGMVENDTQAKLFVGEDGVVSYLNRKGHELFREYATVLGFTPEQVVNQSWSVFWNAFPEMKAAGENLTSDVTLQQQVGKEWFDLHLSPVSDAQGNSMGHFQSWEQVTNRKLANQKAAQMQSMLDQMPINVMMTNINLEITYANPASIEKLTTLQQFLPIPVSELVGQNIDIFHKVPSHQRGLLADPNNLPHRAQINVGPEVLDLLVSPVRDGNGTYIGPMVTWEVITEKLKSENEMARVQNMMDNLPINVMMANRDHNIVYMNPASIKQLKELEHLLPVKADNIVGQSIDIFHKAPEHQRRLLSDPNNLPYRASIKVGDETLDLQASAIFDRDGEYLGPMATWSVITAQIKLANDFERDVKGVISTVTAAATEMQATAQTMTSNTKETARQSQVVASASEEATKNVETVSSAAEELSASISEIAQHVQNASLMSSTAVEEAATTNATIKELGQSSNEIGQVIKVITSIAQQTNLLALNATIEAARAGEAGKGFAVVANEVKELARQTAKATEEISDKIGAIQSATDIAITAVESISERIGNISEIQTTIASAVEEQTAATNEISRNVAEAARGTSEVTSNIASVSEAAEEGGRSAGQLQEAADGLSQESNNLDTVATDFLVKMRGM